MLQLIQDFCHDMNQTNQLTQKKLILQNHCARSPDLVRLLQFVYDSSYIFHITSKNVQNIRNNDRPRRIQYRTICFICFNNYRQKHGLETMHWNKFVNLSTPFLRLNRVS